MKVLVIGEKCSDIFVYGDVERLSPEAPIPVLIPKNIVTNDGMGKNVVNNLLAITQGEDYEIGFVHQERKIVKTRFVEEKSNHPFLRVDEGEFNVDRFEMTEEIRQEIEDADGVIVSDYNKGFLNEEDLIEIAELSKFSILDTKKKLSKKVIKSFDFVKMNEYEFMNNYTKDAKILKKLIITLGSKGANHDGVLYPSEMPKETRDVSGAGDTFTASFTKKFLETKNVGISITFANEMSSIVVSKRGVSTPFQN
jgi:D-beta-D-heptose 7-phosphate kinase/D-beta-D-heptose 1-phosphate adenosyltransferase